MALRVAVTGFAGAAPLAGACPSYLVSDGQATLLLDCGPGTLERLWRLGILPALDVIVVSHMHADHILDLLPFACALSYGPHPDAPTPPLLLPPGGIEALQALARAGSQDRALDGAFDMREYDIAAGDALGGLALRFQPVPHFIPANAIEFSAGGKRFVFGADHGPSPDLTAFARDADVLMLEATLSEPEPPDRRGHLTAAEAGEHAARAGARRLLLTHISDELDADAAVQAASGAYAGPVEVARAGATYVV
jgi:ribonuclease BN (tRNA processing enzyme)